MMRLLPPSVFFIAVLTQVETIINHGREESVIIEYSIGLKEIFIAGQKLIRD